LFAKRPERGRFAWPQVASASVSLTPAQFDDAARRHRLAHACTHLELAA
jgi:transposase